MREAEGPSSCCCAFAACVVVPWLPLSLPLCCLLPRNAEPPPETRLALDGLAATAERTRLGARAASAAGAVPASEPPSAKLSSGSCERRSLSACIASSSSSSRRLPAGPPRFWDASPPGAAFRDALLARALGLGSASEA